MSKFEIIKIDNPNLNNINTIDFLGFDCLLYNEPSKYHNYVNVSKWAIGRRDFNHWFRSSTVKRLIDGFVIKLKRNDLILSVVNIHNDYKGMYMHVDLAIHFAQWISTDFSFKVSQLVKSDILIKYQHEVSNLKSKVVELKTDINIKSNKLEKITHFVNKVSNNIVPTDKWCKFIVFKIINNTNTIYKTMRCKREDYKTRIQKYSNHEIIFNIEVPNAIEFFKTFNIEYTSKNIINISRNNITLKNNTTEQFLIEILKIHQSRIQKIIEISLK